LWWWREFPATGLIQWVAKLDRLKYQKNAKANAPQMAMASPVMNRMRFWCSDKTGFFRWAIWFGIIIRSIFAGQRDGCRGLSPALADGLFVR
jgi:hypothetical protein